MKKYNLAFQAQGQTFEFTLLLDHEKSNHLNIIKHIESRIFYEPDVSKFIIKALTPGDHVIDVGANLGYHTCLMSSICGLNGSVTSFEPDKNNIPDLENNIQANNYSNAFKLIKKLASDANQENLFYLNETDSGGSAMWNPSEWPGNNKSLNPEQVTINSVTLDETIDKNKFYKILKIDTEGAELKVLKGAKKLLQSNAIKYIICELHEFGLNKLGFTQLELTNYMNDLGYSTFILGHKATLPQFVPPKTKIISKVIANLVFCKPEAIHELYPSSYFDVFAF